MFGEKFVFAAVGSENRKTAVVSGGGENPVVDKSLPIVGVDNDVPNGSAFVAIRIVPVVSNGFSWHAFLVHNRFFSSAEVFSVRWSEYRSESRLSGELIYEVGGVSPVRVDEAL